MQELAELGQDENGLLVLGDNIKVLSALSPCCDGAVTCIYMDPPYGNGDSYSHYDDTADHESWLEGMASLLPRVWSLLSDDGSIWISIDDAEMAYLKILCDTYFGRETFQATIVWQHRTTRENRAAFSHNHEYILVYAKNPLSFKKKRNKIPSPELAERYKNPDNDPRGPWQSITATAQAGHSVPSQFYGIRSPLTGKVSYPPKGRCWVYAENKMMEKIKEGRIWFGRDGNGTPRIKKYMPPESPSAVSNTLWTAKEVGTTSNAKKQLLKMFENDEGDVFDTPKPEGLLERIITIATDPGELVLDPFLGSGTAAAVAHKMGRRYIGIDSSRSSFTFAKKRLDHVVNGDSSGISNEVGWKGGGGYLATEFSSWKHLIDKSSQR